MTAAPGPKVARAMTIATHGVPRVGDPEKRFAIRLGVLVVAGAANDESVQHRPVEIGIERSERTSVFIHRGHFPCVGGSRLIFPRVCHVGPCEGQPRRRPNWAVATQAKVRIS